MNYVSIPERFQDIHPLDATVVEVDWYDISESDKWNEDTEKIAPEARTLTLGYLLGYEGQYLYLANGHDELGEDGWTYTLRIPRGVIIAVRSFEAVEMALGAASLEVQDELYML